MARQQSLDTSLSRHAGRVDSGQFPAKRGHHVSGRPDHRPASGSDRTAHRREGQTPALPRCERAPRRSCLCSCGTISRRSAPAGTARSRVSRSFHRDSVVDSIAHFRVLGRIQQSLRADGSAGSRPLREMARRRRDSRFDPGASSAAASTGCSSLASSRSRNGAAARHRLCRERVNAVTSDERSADPLRQREPEGARTDSRGSEALEIHPAGERRRW
jgi:hypothetical protein